MVRAAIALFVAVAAFGLGASARPLRVMSISDCGDQLVLALLPPAQITSVTWLSRDPSASIMAAAARRVPINHGAAEDVLRDRPDLVVAGAYTSPATRALLQRLHYPMLVLGSADSFDDIRRDTRQVAAAVGARARGEALIAEMDAVLAQLARRGPGPRVVAWDGAGFSARPGSMYDALLRAAGARNVAAEPGTPAEGAPSLETLLAKAPDFLVEGQPSIEPPGLRTDVLDNPTIRRIWGDRIVIAPAYDYACGTPFSADGALKLSRDLDAAARYAAPLSLRPEGRR
jgi:iron complex transport system substrate-binding protein